MATLAPVAVEKAQPITETISVNAISATPFVVKLLKVVAAVVSRVMISGAQRQAPPAAAEGGTMKAGRVLSVTLNDAVLTLPTRLVT